MYSKAKKVALVQQNFPRKVTASKEDEEHWKRMSDPTGGYASATGASAGNEQPSNSRSNAPREVITLPNVPANINPDSPAALQYDPEYMRQTNIYNDPMRAAAFEMGDPSIPDYASNDTRSIEEKRSDFEAELRRQGVESERERIKQLLRSYAPYVGGGAALGALLGGYIGYRNNQTLAGSLLGGLGGAGLGAGAKYLYDRYNAQA